MRIVLATGGTGGHLFPALSVAQALRADGHEIFFLGSFRTGRQWIKQEGFTVEDLPARGVMGNGVLKTIVSVWFMLKACVLAFKHLRKYAPDVVLGFGGYGAFPVVWASLLGRYPSMIHEQNVVPGRANAFLAKFVKRVAISFPESKKYFNAKKTVLTGCPVRMNFLKSTRDDILEKFSLKNSYKTIFVFGGSQGSQRINDTFFEAMMSFDDSAEVQVVHVTGKKAYSSMKEKYAQTNLPVAIFDFLDVMHEAYQIADLVISRAGAATVTEIAQEGIPSILIPYPYAGGHQKENAQILSRVNMAMIIEEKELTSKSLKDAIRTMLANPVSTEECNRRLKDLRFPNAIQDISNEALAL